MKNPFSYINGKFTFTLRKKFIIIFTIYGGLISTFIFLYFPIKPAEQALKFAADKAQSITAMTAFNVSSTLLYEDSKDMEKILESVEKNRDIVYLIVCDKTENIFSCFNYKTALKADYRFMAREGAISADGLIYRTSAPIIHNNKEIGMIFLGMSLENIKSETERSKKTIAVISSLIFILGTLAVFFISVVITKPLKNMVGIIEEISGGDLSKRIAFSSHDEVGNLAISFNSMVAKLENFSRELQELNNELEDKVAKRTKKLEVEVNERRLAEQALKKSEEKYRRLVDNSLVGIYVTEDYFLQFCNRRFAEIFGYREPSEIIGKHLRKLVTEDSWPLVAKRGLNEPCGENNLHYECKGLKKDGKIFDIEVFDSCVIYDGKPVIEGILIDITIRKRAEEERKKLEEQLRHTQKMESIGVLAGGIAHDFNNILSAVIGYTELTLDCVPPDSSAKFNLDRIFFASNRAKEMIKRILTFSRKEEGGRKPILLKEVVEDMLKLMRATLPTTIEIRQDIEESTNPVMANESEIHQVLLNLCTNADHAMRAEGGILSVSLKEVYLEPGATKGNNLNPGKYQQLTVSDTGHGMTPEIMDRMFDPYFTTKKEGEGTGMGLSVVHGIIKSCGGDIVVHSHPGKGTTVHVFLPVTYEKNKVAPARKKVETTAALRGKNETVLVVDDEPFIAELDKEIIEDLGYHVIMKTGGPEALAAFQSEPGKFDLIITDQVMPHMTGVQLAREIKKISPGIPVILCSGFTDMINEENYKAFAVDAFLLKPILQNELAETINKVLGKPVESMLND